jgi:glycoside/pentoside/hexuronide:cation symporter, GPH family
MLYNQKDCEEHLLFDFLCPICAEGGAAALTTLTEGAPMNAPLKFRQKLSYGVADTAFSLTSTIIGVYFAIFLTDVIGINPALAAIAFFIGKSWDYINDPIMGYISDRTRTKWGRRRPFLLFGALPYALSFVLLWTRCPFDSAVGIVAYYALAYVLYDTFASIVYMPYFALTPELTSDYDERTSLTAFRMFFSIFASLVAFILPTMITGAIEPANAGRFVLMAAIFAAVSAGCLLWTFFGTRENPENMQLEEPSFKESLQAALKNRPFIFSTIIYLFTWVAVGMLQTSLLYFIKYVIQREPMSDIIMGSIFIMAILVLPLWDWLSRKFNKRYAYALGIGFWAVVQVALIFTTAATPLWGILVLCVLAGIGVSAAHVLPWAIIPDAIEVDQLDTGNRHEGMFYSLIILANKIAQSIAIPAMLLILDWTNYDGTAAVQTREAINGIRLVVGPLPAVLLIFGIVFALTYPLDREKYNDVRAQLREREEAAAAGGS